jgi:hypothetical protein
MRRVLSVALWVLALALVFGHVLVAKPSRDGSARVLRSAAGTTYYVGPSGSNDNPGTRAAPWATPGFGSRQLVPGDTLIILGGRYVLSEFDADILMPPSGTANAWVTIQGEEGHRPVLAGRDDLFSAVSIDGCSYLRIENLEITHDSQAQGEARYFRFGIAGSGAPVSHVVLEDLYVHHIDEGALDLCDVDDLQVLNCRMEYCGLGALGGPTQEHGGWRNVRVEGCTMSWSGHYYQGGDGSDRPYDRPDGFGVEESNGPIEIVNCVAEHNYGDGLDSKAANTTIRRCIVANNSCDGIKLWHTGCRVENTLVYGRGDANPDRTPWSPVVIHTDHPGGSFEIVNCTIDDALGGNYLMHVQYDTPDVPLNLLVRNTIWRGAGENSPIFVAPASHVIVENNLFYVPNSDHVIECGGRTYTAADVATLGSGSRYGDPLFVRPAWGSAGDYRLQQGSPAINHGTPSGAPVDDITGMLRDSTPDIGAYEYWQPTHWLWLPVVLKHWTK